MGRGKAVRINKARIAELAKWTGEAFAEETYALAEEVRDLRKILDAARCIRHWHDSLGGEGMVVSFKHVRKLLDAIQRYDEA